MESFFSPLEPNKQINNQRRSFAPHKIARKLLRQRPQQPSEDRNAAPASPVLPLMHRDNVKIPAVGVNLPVPPGVSEALGEWVPVNFQPRDLEDKMRPFPRLPSCYRNHMLSNG